MMGQQWWGLSDQATIELRGGKRGRTEGDEQTGETFFKEY